MPITPIETWSEFMKVINGPAPAIIEFWAPWCESCKAIAPIYDKFANEPAHAKLAFYKLDTEANERPMEEAGVRLLPAFMMFQNGNKIGESVGAVPAALAALIKKHASAVDGSAAAAPTTAPATE
ncbi:thioredoxin [Mycena rebaudengoi]|nr:thioredoxin [Mycena rebaudengoi]